MNTKNIGVKLRAGQRGFEEDGDTSLKNVSSIQAQLNVKKYMKRSVMMSQFVQAEFKDLNRKFGSGDAIYQRPKGIHVLEATNMPSLLIETGFICNDKDEAYLCSNAGQQQLAEAIMRAFVKYKSKVEPANGAQAANVATTTKKPSTPSIPSLPAGIEKRENNIVKTLNITDENVTLTFYDDGIEDGDIITILFNGKEIVSKQTLTNDPFIINVKAQKGMNELVMYANNLGTMAPNTALLKITADKRDNRVSLMSNEKVNATVMLRME
jgi:hypothetical protein